MLSFQQLIQNLTDITQPTIVRSSAIAELATQGNPQCVKFLIEALADLDAMIRRDAAKALQDLEAKSATEPLLSALQKESNDLTLWAMLEAISELGTPNVLSTLEPLLNIDSMLTRIEVKKSISRIQNRYAAEATATSTEDGTSVEEPKEKVTDEQPSISIEMTAPKPSVDSTEPTLTGLDERTDPVDDAQSGIDEPEPRETGQPAADLRNHFDEETVDVDKAADETHFTDELDETEGTDPEEDDTDINEMEEPQREDDTDINDLSDAIARSPRLAGSSVNLPVLAPNAATVPYPPKGTALEPTRTNFFFALLYPNRYFSKQWVSRTRAYLILWAVLIAGVIAFTQHQKHFRAESDALPRIGLSAAELPELVKRSLAAGDFYIQEGHYRRAIDAYELSRELSALPIEFYRKLGFAYFKEGQSALAVEAYELFLEARDEETPDVFAAQASLVGVYPLTLVGEGTTTQDYETYNILGTAYAELGRMLDAQRAYEQAIRLAPKHGEAYNNLARLHADNYQQPLAVGLGNPEISPKLRLAEALAYTAVTLNPDVAAYHDTLGWILSKRGQVNKAMKTLERAINLQKDAIAPHYHLAQVALAANERQKAVQAIRNVFELKPSFVPLNTIK